MAGQAAAAGERGTGSVQSISRAFSLLEVIADLGGAATLSRLADHSGLPQATVHRLLRTLVDLGYVRQEESRQYALAPRLVRLGEIAKNLLGTWAVPHLQRLVDATGESANLAMLEGDQVVYTAQVPGLHAMRMFTEVGRRASVHCTAVGKAMLADLPPDRVRAIVVPSGMPAQTPHTITTIAALTEELARIRAQGFAVDDEEQEVGVRCVAVAVPGGANHAALSVSGPSPRMTADVLRQAIPLLTDAARALADDLATAGASARAGQSGASGDPAGR